MIRTASTSLSKVFGIAVLLSLIVAFSLALVACQSGPAGGALQRVKQSGVLRVGTDATYPPFEWIDTASGEVEGFDADLVREVCRDIGCRAEFVVVPFDGIIAGLVSNKYDMIASTFTITPERAEHVAFSEPYYDGGQAIAVPVYDTTTQTPEDLQGKSIGVQLGTTGERRAGQIKNAHIISFENIGAAFIDMENGRLDAVINDRPTTELIIQQRHAAKIVGPTLTAERYGFAVTKDDEELLGAINAALAKIKSDGRYEKIRARWFGTPAG